MQRSVLNRATMRVADTTDVSARVTADSREKQTMKPTIRRWLALAIAFLGLYLALPDCGLAQNNQGQNDQGVNLGVPNGTYSTQITGQIPDPSGSGKLVPIVVAGRGTYFANGTVSGVVSFSLNGQVQKVTFTGTFKANGDGSFSESDANNQGTPLHFILYPTLDGNTINEIETDPGTIVSGVETR